MAAAYRQRTVADSDVTTGRWHPPIAARLLMALGALGAAAIVGAIIALARSAQFHLIVAALHTPKPQVEVLKGHLPFLGTLIAVPLVVAIVTYNILRLMLLIYGWRRYLSRLARELEAKVAVRARLVPLGYVPLVRNSLSGSPGNPKTEPLTDALHAYPRLLLTGEDGSGKTIALWRHALEIARGATTWRIVTGRQTIPILVSLSRYTTAEPAPDGLRLGFLAETLRQYGAKMLAGQLPALLRHGRVQILFDGLDEIAAPQVIDIIRELSMGLNHRYKQVRVIITCRSAPLLDISEHLPLLKQLPQVTLLPLSDDEIRQLIQRAGRLGQLGPLSAATMLADIDDRVLLPLYRRPATLGMVIDLVGAGQDIPDTRARVLSDYEALLFSQAGVNGDRLVRTRRALGYLALAYRITGLAEISGAQAWNERMAVKGLLADTTKTTTTLGGNTRPLEFDEAQLVEAIDLACMAGVLERGYNNRGLRFRHNLLLYLAAARHLDVSDIGLGRVSATLLRPEWAEIVVLWGELTFDPVGLAERFSRLAQTPASTAATANLMDLDRGEPLALGLALTIAVVRLTPSAVAFMDAKEKQAAETAQHNLRDLFDRVLRYGANEQEEGRERHQRLSLSLQLCENSAAGEFAPALSRLVRSSGVNRLLRAQAVQVLGLSASLASLGELTSLLMEPDPIVREALQRGFHLAGADAADPLLDLMTQYPPSETIHRRALDALIAVDGAAVPSALARLNAPTVAGRIAAITALGALRDRRGLDMLMELLKDTDATIRLAATRALGRMGDTKVQAELLHLLSVNNEEQRIAAAEALGILRSERAMKPLIKLLDDRQPKVRAAAAEALGHLGDIRAVDSLRKHLSDKDAWAQAAAATALRALGQRA